MNLSIAHQRQSLWEERREKGGACSYFEYRLLLFMWIQSTAEWSESAAWWLLLWDSAKVSLVWCAWFLRNDPQETQTLYLQWQMLRGKICVLFFSPHRINCLCSAPSLCLYLSPKCCVTHINISIRHFDVIFLTDPSLCSVFLTANMRASGPHCVGVSLSLWYTEIIGNHQCKHPTHLKSNNVYVCVFTAPWLCW